MKTYLTIAAYLVSIVIANLTVAWFGPAVVIVNAFVLIALDLTARDRLHEAWHGDARKLGALIATGSILSAALDYRAAHVAIASCAAFALSETADTLVYARLHARPWWQKVNGSNVVSAAVDSLTFLTLLSLLARVPWFAVPIANQLPLFLVPGLAAAQWLAKTLGGAVWAWILRPREARYGDA